MLDLRKISQWTLFICIVIFIVTTNIILNRIAHVVMIAICGMCLFRDRSFKIKYNGQLLSMFLYGILLTFSMTYAISPEEKIKSVLLSYIITLIISFFILNNINNKSDIDFFMHAFMVASIAQLFYMLTVYGVNIFEVIRENDNRIRIGDAVSNSNSVGLSFAYGAVIATYFFQQSKGKNNHIRVTYLMIAIITTIFGLLSGSRKTLIVLFVGLFVVFRFCGANKKNIIQELKVIIISILAIGILYYVIKNVDIFSTISRRTDMLFRGLFESGHLDNSSANRFKFIEEGWQAFCRRPILGEGIYASYYYFQTYSHNNFVEVLMNTGIIGFIIFYFPYIVNLHKFIKMDKMDKRYWFMLFFYLWVLLGAYGMVNYYSKLSMSLVTIVSVWIDLNYKGETEPCKLNTL